jgi:predicted permease
MMDKAIYSFLLILVPLVLGRLAMGLGLFRRLDADLPGVGGPVGIRTSPDKSCGGGQPAGSRLERLRIAGQKLVLLGFNPVIALGAIWSLDLSDSRLLILPLIGLSIMAVGLAFGVLGSRLLKLEPFRAGVYSTCGSFANSGNMGGLIVYMLLGEGAYALVPLYRLFEDFWNYGVLFPIARDYGEKARAGQGEVPQRGSNREGIRKVLRDPFFLASLASLIIGLSLNLAGFHRPAFYGKLNSVLIPAGSVLFLFTIGMRMMIARFGSNAPIGLILTLGKTIAVPACAFMLASALGMGGIYGGIPLQVVFILATSPVGFLGLVPPTLYGLDRNLANTLWLVSNTSLALTIPVLTWLVGQ